MAQDYYTKVLECADFIKTAFDAPVGIGVLTGTGLSDSLNEIEPICTFGYNELPHFPVSTVKGHAGRLLIGRIGKKTVLLMQGRFHLYEGYTPEQVSFPVRVMQQMGIGTLLINNAAGGINPELSPGDIMLITDHINLTGQNPLVGPNDDRWGTRFPDMTRVYHPGLTALAQKVADKTSIKIYKGVYAGLLGPSLETPAEIRFLRAIGSDAVGLSTVMEVIAAVHAGMDILGMSLITNFNDPDNPVQTTLDSVLEVASRHIPDLNRLLVKVIEQI